MINLIQAPSDTPLRIADISGGHGVRRRLLALGFHKSDILNWIREVFFVALFL